MTKNALFENGSNEIIFFKLYLYYYYPNDSIKIKLLKNIRINLYED